MTARQKSHLYHELSKLLEAGLGLLQSTEALAKSSPTTEERRALEEVKAAVEDGKKVDEAFAATSAGISEMEVSLIRAGDRIGRLGESFEKLGDHFDLVRRTEREISTSLLYPAVLLHLVVLVSSIPFGEAFELSEWLVSFAVRMVVVYLLLGGLWFGWKFLHRQESSRLALVRVMDKIPVIGGALRKMAVARFMSVFHACVASGLNMKESVHLAGRAGRHPALFDAQVELEAAVEDGQELSPVFKRHRVFGEAFARSMAASELTGSLDKDLERWSAESAEEAERAARTVAIVVPKAVYAVVVVFVVYTILSFYGNYFGQLNDL